jgi:competence protein ComEA
MRRVVELSIAVVIGLIIGGLITIIASPPRGKSIELIPVVPPSEIIVYITGAVNKPGVYTLPIQSRVIDAISIAEGLTSDAYDEGINMADKLYDGTKVYIPKIGESDFSTDRSGVITMNDGCTPSTPGLALQTERININSATIDDLDMLPGIGPEKAKEIIAYRQQNGNFNNIEDILLVPGIGNKLFEDIEGLITTE